MQGKFLAFYQYAKSFNADDFDYAELQGGDYVFMRWKVSPGLGGCHFGFPRSLRTLLQAGAAPGTLLHC